MDILSCARVFWSERHKCIGFALWLDFLMQIILIFRAYPALLNLAFFIKTRCVARRSCFTANSRASLGLSFTESKGFPDVWHYNARRFCLKELVEWVEFSKHFENIVLVILHNFKKTLYFVFWFVKSKFAKKFWIFPACGGITFCEMVVL